MQIQIQLAPTHPEISIHHQSECASLATSKEGVPVATMAKSARPQKLNFSTDIGVTGRLYENKKDQVKESTFIFQSLHVYEDMLP